MSKTPRTDDQAIRIMFGMLDTVVPVEFARELETELADKDRQLVEARAEIERQNAKFEEMLNTAETYQELCTCYRLCKKPTQKLLEKLDKARVFLAAERNRINES